MDERNAQVGWTEAQWNRVCEEVLRAWQRVRVAGSFLPAYGPLPPSTQVVPSEIFNPDGTIDDKATAVVLEIALPVTLTRQQVGEEDLSSALLQFRRRATQVGQLEDWYIFNGTSPSHGFPARTTARGKEKAAPTDRIEAMAELPSRLHLPAFPFLDDLVSRSTSFLTGAPEPIADPHTQTLGLLLRNPGALGLIAGAKEVMDKGGSAMQVNEWQIVSTLNNDGLMSATVNAIDSLEKHGYVAPYVCVFGLRPFEAAHRPIGDSIAFPRDRLEPLIGRELLHASAIDVPPRSSDPSTAKDWPSRGVLLSLAGDAVDLAIAAEATPEFRQVDMQGRYVFSVFERFTLRIKDSKAIVPLIFYEP
jgi:uncharacterized linocin/CFP29 family protein